VDKFFKKWQYVVLLGILLFGFLLRNNNLHEWPRLGATFDEYAWTWQGMSLIQNHVPTSWSPHPQYTHAKDITYQHTHFRLVTPYLEHPPLFGLIVGGYAILSGVRDMFHVDLAHIRGLSLLLGVVSIGILFFFVREVYEEKVALLSSFLYAIIPSVVVGSRLVENENFFIPVFLFALFLIAKYIKNKNIWFRNWAAILCGLLLLAKIPWGAATLAIILLFLFLRKYKDAWIFLAIVLPIFSLFFVYGMYFDKELFFNLWKLQLNRYDIAFNSMFALFTYPVLTDRLFIDGWIYFGWISFFLLGVKDFRKHVFILLPLLAYFAIFVYAIPNEPGHGWYRYPFYPFLIISIALFIKEYFNKNYFLTFFFLLFTGLSMLNSSWAQVLGFSFFIFRFFLVLSGITLLPLFFPKTQKLAFVFSYINFGWILLLTLWSTLLYNEQ